MPESLCLIKLDRFSQPLRLKPPWRPICSKPTTAGERSLKCWETWDTTCGHKAKDILHHRSPGGERGLERGSARRSSLKGRERAIVSQTNIGTVSKATLGKTSEIIMGFTELIDTVLNWTTAGKLYVLTEFLQLFYVVCLNACSNAISLL